MVVVEAERRTQNEKKQIAPGAIGCVLKEARPKYRGQKTKEKPADVGSGKLAVHDRVLQSAHVGRRDKSNGRMEPSGAEPVGAVNGPHSKEGKGQLQYPAFCGSEQLCPEMQKNLNAGRVCIDQNALLDQLLPALKTESEKNGELIMAQRDMRKVPKPQYATQQQDQPNKVWSGFLFHLHKVHSIQCIETELPEWDDHPWSLPGSMH